MKGSNVWISEFCPFNSLHGTRASIQSTKTSTSVSAMSDTSSAQTNNNAGPLVATESTQTGLTAIPAINQMVTVKLSGDNYLLWTTQLFPCLRTHQLLGYIDGTYARPASIINQSGADGIAHPVINPEFNRWYQQDQLVMSGILSTLTEGVLAQVAGCTTAREVWCAIERAFAASSRAQIMQIRMQLATIQKKDLSVNEYFRKVKGLADTLAMIGKRLEDDEVIAYMLRGLGSEYDPLVTSLTTCVDAVTISDVYAHMLSYELRLEHNNSSIQVNQVSKT